MRCSILLFIGIIFLHGSFALAQTIQQISTNSNIKVQHPQKTVNLSQTDELLSTQSLEVMNSPFIVAAITEIDQNSQSIQVEVFNKFILDNMIHDLNPSVWNEHINAIILTMAEHYALRLEINLEEHTIDASDEGLIRMEKLASFFDRKLKLDINRLLIETDFGKDEQAIIRWQRKAEKILDGIFDELAYSHH